MIGTTVSHYRILELLGSGGMGVVYKAEDTKLRRTIALKFLPPALTCDPEAKERFIHEAQAASALDHPNICNVHDVGETSDGQTFIVMAYYGGETLDKKIKRGPLPLNEALDIVVQVALGLAKAHQHGIVHRDIKPANIIVSDQGEVKILDFGLAKLSGLSMMTRTGSTMGTPLYMSPEQARGEKVDHRTDLWSLGVILYQMVSGELPFQSDYEQALIYGILNQEPRQVREINHQVPESVELIIQRLLQKDPIGRYATADDLLTDLLAVRDNSSAHIGKPTLRKKQVKSAKVVLYKTGILFIIAAIALALWRVISPHGSLLNPEMTFREISFPFSRLVAASLSRDGNWAALVAPDENNRWDVYFMNISGGEARRITSRKYRHIDAIEISPDGSQIAYEPFTSYGINIWVVPTLGGTPRQLTHTMAQATRWHPDGRRIGFIRAGQNSRKGTIEAGWEYWTVNIVDGKEELVFADSNYSRTVPFDFDWSPSGDAIAFNRCMPHRATPELFVRELKTGRERQLTNDSSLIASITWLQDDHIVYSSQKDGTVRLWAVSADGGPSERLTKDPGQMFEASGSADCRKLLTISRYGNPRLMIGEVDSKEPVEIRLGRETLTQGLPSIRGPRLSPDGKRLAYTADGISSNPKLRVRDLWVVDRNGENRLQLTDGDYAVDSHEWSADGKWIAYEGMTLTPPENDWFYLVSSQGDSQPRRVMISTGVGFVGWGDTSSIIVYDRSKGFLYYDLGGKLKMSCMSADSIVLLPIGTTGYYLCRDHRNPQEKTGSRVMRLSEPPASIPGMRVRSMFTLAPKIQLPKGVNEYGASSNRRWFLYGSNNELWMLDIISGRSKKFPWEPPTVFWGGIGAPSDDGREVPYVDPQEMSKLVLVENAFK